MLINLKVKTLDARTHDFSVDNEITIREFKDKIAEKTNICAENQRIIYQGRVLADDKKIKDYDVDGKVLHVAERPPFSQRGTNSRNNDEPRSARHGRGTGTGNLRNSPLFRALDGMLVGTMTIPVNSPGINQAATSSPLASSSSFCMNRITVARHMIDCANNIAAYLENPEVGLNNTSLDILERGRWTMESTVVEVGVSADLPRNQNLIDMVQGAVTAALSRNNQGRNYTVLQLPPVYTSDNGPGTSDDPDPNSDTNQSADRNAEAAPPASTAVIIEDVIEAEDEALTEGSNTVEARLPQTSTTPPSSGSPQNNENSRRNTGTSVLAEVINQYRTVQLRLNPFFEQYYNMLLNEPIFEESESTARENAQRVYDRVSEAFHYLSHAQHAISDLMLDLSQPAPRFLTCRPILVEQSGYIRSNNILAPNVLTTSIRPHQQQQAERALQETVSSAAGATPSTANSANNADEAASSVLEAHGSTLEEEPANASVEDPIDDPMVAPNQNQASRNGQGAPDTREARLSDPPRLRLYLPYNHQVQMARLIQAVVNSATADTELHVQINAPNLMAINVPEIGRTSINSRSLDDLDIARSRGSIQIVNDNSATGNNENQVSVNTNTLPTTSTQTRSTSRPQIQIGSNNNWNGRLLPSNTAFDRFLPCNSHHIREPENPSSVGNSNNRTPLADNQQTSVTYSRNLRASNPRLFLPSLRRRQNRAAVGSATANLPSSTTNGSGTNSARSRRLIALGNIDQSVGGGSRINLTDLLSNLNYRGANQNVARSRSIPRVNRSIQSLTRTNATPMTPSGATSSETTANDNLRSQLRNFLNQIVFEGAPINDGTIPSAINRALNWFGESLIYLPQYEKPEYNSRDSVCNILRFTLTSIIKLFVEEGLENNSQFETRLKQICEQFRTRLYSVLFVCVGRANAELYWGQLMRLLLVPLESSFRNEAFQFLCIYLNPTIPPNADTADVEQFLVLRNNNELVTNTVETDVEMVDMASASDTSNNDSIAAFGVSSEPEPLLPTVVAGSEPWHNNFPIDWLPIITRDLQTQSEHSQTQAPYSDAYISGMSAKRRKIIQSTKPPPNIESMIAENVRRAVQNADATGLGTSSQTNTTDSLAAAVSNDPTVQASYTEAIRSNICERLKTDPNFKSDKFPHTKKFIEKK